MKGGDRSLRRRTKGRENNHAVSTVETQRQGGEKKLLLHSHRQVELRDVPAPDIPIAVGAEHRVADLVAAQREDRALRAMACMACTPQGLASAYAHTDGTRGSSGNGSAVAHRRASCTRAACAPAWMRPSPTGSIACSRSRRSRSQSPAALAPLHRIVLGTVFFGCSFSAFRRVSTGHETALLLLDSRT